MAARRCIDFALAGVLGAKRALATLGLPHPAALASLLLVCSVLRHRAASGGRPRHRELFGRSRAQNLFRTG